MDKYIGKKLEGRYEIRELVGVGGMANVYKGYDVVEDRTVAIKILRDEFLDNKKDLFRSFLLDYFIHSCCGLFFTRFDKIQDLGIDGTVAKLNMNDVAHFDFSACLGYFPVNAYTFLITGVFRNGTSLYQS